MIDPAFWRSESIAQLNETQRLLFIGIISNADDQGRMSAHPALVRSDVYPYDDKSLEEIESNLQAIVNVGSIMLYEVDDKRYLQIPNWWEYQKPQWAYPSKLPSPDGWQDRLRYREDNKVIAKNWETPKGKSIGKSLPNDDSKDDSISNSISNSDSKIIMSASADYQAVRKCWIELFPDKPRPRENNKTLAGKVKTRMKCADFRESWKIALERASQSSFLHREGFYDLSWFLKNDDNWEKCLNGNYDDKPKSRKPRPGQSGADEWLARRKEAGL